MASTTGTFTISLDFELYWGVQDHRPLASYARNLLGARDAIPRMLELFERYGVHCTWATVGLLFFDRKAELMEYLPEPRPRYANPALSPYPRLGQIGPNERQDPYHYGLSLIEQIRDCPGQEIGTHTFSHYYCLEPGETEDDQSEATFRADLLAARRAAERLGITPRSLVFPRNQYRADYLETCRAVGLEAVRGNHPAWWFRAESKSGEGLAKRACRLCDDYLPLSREDCCLRPLALGGGLVDVRASRFLRPTARPLRPLEPLRLHRITAGLSRAARHGMNYHLWWHPHNFGGDPEYSLSFLERVLQHFGHLAQTHGMRSASMLEVAREWAASEQPLAEAPAAQLSAEVAGVQVAGPVAVALQRSHGLAALSKKAVRG
ncbi:MAG: polysaccharide deacetylase family protein [Geminicoccaceae bacterium]